MEQNIDGLSCTIKDPPKSCTNRMVFDEIDARLKTKLKEGYIPISCQGQVPAFP